MKILAVPAEQRSPADDAGLGALLLRADRTEEAMQALQRARERLQPNPPELLADLVCALVSVGRSDDARAAMAELEQLQRESSLPADRITRAVERARAVLAGG